MSKRIVFTGPESTGKSFLASLVSKTYNTPLVLEYAREYLEQLERPYDLSDLKKIEEGQQKAEAFSFQNQPDVIVQDTDFLTIWIWYTYKYNLYPDRVYNYLQRHLPHFYFLSYPDIKWEKDPLRENPNDLVDLYEEYLRELEKLKVPFHVIRGSFEERTESCLSTMQKIL